MVKAKEKTFMLIDDNAIDNEVNAKLLQFSDLVESVIVKQSGINALNYLKNNIDKDENLPDVILLDIYMPEMDGFGFLEEFKQLPEKITEHVTVYMLSSSQDNLDMNRAESNPYVYDVLKKPLDVNKLIETLR